MISSLSPGGLAGTRTLRLANETRHGGAALTPTCGVTCRGVRLACALARVQWAADGLERLCRAGGGVRTGWRCGAAEPGDGEGGANSGAAATTHRASASAGGQRCCGSRAPFRPPSRRPRGAAQSSWCSWQVKEARARDVAGTPPPAYLQSQGPPAFPPGAERPGCQSLASQRFPVRLEYTWPDPHRWLFPAPLQEALSRPRPRNALNPAVSPVRGEGTGRAGPRAALLAVEPDSAPPAELAPADPHRRLLAPPTECSSWRDFNSRIVSV
ncbi:hypothetical protein Celaphus_00015919 [Cervus elaphus hippelaphus]|uniref:Uncharacterized protein n=1 Tax=Cervus elaphus hippelaphus TaxID=46360 RepID=A0A212C1U1_CEREH|nr:hypothetical protein Celaphus_00015919 [Cervus elaphus hippelaphus]